MFVCPTAVDAMLAPGEIATAGSNGYYNIWGVEHDASITQRPTYFCYVPNSKIDQTQNVQKLNQIRPGSLVALLVEKRMTPGEIPNRAGPDGQNYYTKTLSRVKSDWQRFAGAHRGGGHILFADTHVAWFTNLEIAHPKGALLRSDWNQPNKIIWNPFGKAN